MANPTPNIQSVSQYLNLNPDDVDWSKRQSRLFLSHLVAIQSYLSDDLKSTKDWADRVLAYGDDYFLGPWREHAPSGDNHDQPPDRVWQDRNMPWQDEFQACCLWGACLGDWNILGRLTQSLPADILQDIDQTPENRAWLLIVAEAVQEHSWDKLDSLIGTVRNGRSQRERLLLGFLDALYHGNDEQLHKSSDQYFKYYKKSEIKQLSITAKVATDGTFLVNLGRHRGREVPIPSNMIDHIIINYI